MHDDRRYMRSITLEEVSREMVALCRKQLVGLMGAGA